MGGKSQPTQAPPPPTVGDTSQPSVDTEMMGQLMQMMAAQAAASAAMAAMPQVPEVPPVYTSPEIDWTEQSVNLILRLDQMKPWIGLERRALWTPFIQDLC